MIGLLIESFVCLFDLLFLFFLFGLFFERRSQEKRDWWLGGVCFLVIAVLVGFLSSSYVLGALGGLIFLLVSVGLFIFLHKDSPFCGAAYSSLYMLLIALCEFSFLFIGEQVLQKAGFVYSNTLGGSWERLAVALSARAVAVLVLAIVWRLKIKIVLERLSAYVIIPFTFISIFSIQLLLDLFLEENNAVTRKAVSVAFLFMFSFLVSMFLVAIGRYRVLLAEKEKAVFESRLSISEEKSAGALESYKRIAKLSHDYKNHLKIISMLVTKQGSNDASEYIEKVLGETPAGINSYTGVASIDAVLSAKHEAAESKGIEFDCDVIPPAFSTLNRTDVCTILMNLLDNAIEGAATAEEKKFIKVTAANVNAMYLVKVENSYVEGKSAPERSDGEHGYGLKIVEGVADRYNGWLNITKNGSTFVATVLLNS